MFQYGPGGVGGLWGGGRKKLVRAGSGNKTITEAEKLRLQKSRNNRMLIIFF